MTSAAIQVSMSSSVWFKSEEDFKGLYHIWAWQPSWSYDQAPLNKLSLPNTRRLPMKFGFSFGGENSVVCLHYNKSTWAIAWKKQQYDLCAQLGSDQPGHLPCLCWPHEKALGPWLPIECTVKTLSTFAVVWQKTLLFVCLFCFIVASTIFSHITTVSGCSSQLNAHFYSAASLKNHSSDTWHYTTPNHIILTLGGPVLVLSCKSGCQARSILNNFGMSRHGIEPLTSRSPKWAFYPLSYWGR